jgi:diguanylate cyclase (GGDEF)-like protein
MPFFHTAHVLEVHAANTLPVLFYTAFVVAGTLGVMWMEIELLQAKLTHSARTDALTGLINRGGFEQEFDRELSRSSRDGTGFSVALFDLDHFKRVNDTHGHAAGDALLCAFAGLLADAVRRHDVAARYGGEEFALLMPGVGKDEAIRIADRLRERTAAAPIAAGSAFIGLTVSGGVATFGADGRDIDALLGSADRALYAAKDAGRNRVLGASAQATG